MQKRLLIGTLVLTTLMFSACRITTLTVYNDSNWDTICHVYVSPEFSDSWGADELGSTEVIEPGFSRAFYQNAGMYDVKLVSCDGYEADYDGLNLRTDSSITYYN